MMNDEGLPKAPFVIFLRVLGGRKSRFSRTFSTLARLQLPRSAKVEWEGWAVGVLPLGCRAEFQTLDFLGPFRKWRAFPPANFVEVV
jgi:hypothetical protein